MVEYDDKRNFFRMMVNSECSIEVIGDSSGQTFRATCLDLSATGMSFEVEQELPADTEITAKLESTNTQIPSLKASAKVVRCTQQSESSYVVGVEIIAML